MAEVVWERRFPVELRKEVEFLVPLEHGVMVKLRWNISQSFREIDEKLWVVLYHYGQMVQMYSNLNRERWTQIDRDPHEGGYNIALGDKTLRIDDTDQSKELPVGQGEIAILKYPADIVVQLLAGSK
ncbi:MAG TPA: hypothetical protein VN495_01210 [Candidatus Paceibacterota bacterium]|nr:hypothetical protein [Candidatus Paceibacterota bacterium]